MLKPDFKIPDKWIIKKIEKPTTIVECPYCHFNFEPDRTVVLPYFCGGCGKDMRGNENEQ